jgi:hypothetical protein
VARPVLLLLAEAACFGVASVVHRGLLVGGYEHDRAAVAETVIGAVLLLGALLTVIRPSRARGLGVAAQMFAIVGTLVGLFTVAIGVGPQTAPDLAYHASILALLVAGLALTRRWHVHGAELRAHR